MGAVTEPQQISQNVTVYLGTFADEVIDQEAERSFQNVIAMLDEVATIKSSQANHLRRQIKTVNYLHSLHQAFRYLMRAGVASQIWPFEHSQTNFVFAPL